MVSELKSIYWLSETAEREENNNKSLSLTFLVCNFAHGCRRYKNWSFLLTSAESGWEFSRIVQLRLLRWMCIYSRDKRLYRTNWRSYKQWKGRHFNMESKVRGWISWKLEARQARNCFLCQQRTRQQSVTILLYIRIASESRYEIHNFRQSYWWIWGAWWTWEASSWSKDISTAAIEENQSYNDTCQSIRHLRSYYILRE